MFFGVLLVIFLWAMSVCVCLLLLLSERRDFGAVISNIYKLKKTKR